jgi:uncharacterized protein (DUF1800 family)
MRGLLILFVAWLMTTAVPAMTVEAYQHLLARTGFGSRPSDLVGADALSYEQAVKALLDGVRRVAVTPAPTWVNEPPPAPPDRNASEEAKQEFRKQAQREMREHGQELKAWWYREMLATPSPLTERMTLFWSNHFTSSLEKVRFTPALYKQNILLRRMAFGNFAELLHEIARDPAMVRYLDSVSNVRGKPNENFGRELLELFTLGEGHYTEQDIKQAARAFTGYGIDRRTGLFRYNPTQHDSGVKSFMGRSGNFNGDDIINIVLENPQTARHIVEKLWREFISPTPDAAEVEKLATMFRQNKYEIKPLMQALLTSPVFRAEAQRGTLIKSPAELMVGTLRTFQIPVEDTRPLLGFGVQMGQDLFNPPNVKGWEGGEAWINANTLLIRRQFVERALRGQEQRGKRRPPDMQLAAAPGEMEMQANAEAMQPEPMEKQMDDDAPPPYDEARLRQRIQQLKQQGQSREQIKAQVIREGLAPEPLQGSVRARTDAAALNSNPDLRAKFREAALKNPQLRQQITQWKQQGLTPMQIHEKAHEYVMTKFTPEQRRKLLVADIDPKNKEARKERMMEVAKMLPMPAADIDKWLAQATQIGNNNGTPLPPSEAAQAVLLPLTPTAPAASGDTRTMVVSLLLDPVYQLK